MTPTPQEITQLLVDWSNGDRAALDKLLPLVNHAELLAVDEALAKPTALDARKGRIVELRFFGGLSLEETAQVLGISSPTVQREWRAAKAWLHRMLTDGGVMNSERWERIESLFNAALERDSGEREAFLAQACGDAALRREVEALLAAHAAEVESAKFPAKLVAEMFAGERAARRAGEVIGPYQILSLLGKGGMGEVYRARDARLSRDVAVKVLPQTVSQDAERLRRFEREARAASALNHPNIITIHEIGAVQTEAGETRYIVTECVAGETLRQRMTAEKISLSEALEVATQGASALAAAHEAGIIHRDIKPENVMVRLDGLVKVLDFGLAKLTMRPLTEVDSQTPTLPKQSTAPGVVMGTVSYMSPEQARGQEVDGRSDIFSLGVVLYEMIAGRAPFEGVNALDIVGAILNHEPAPLGQHAPETPAELQRIVTKALRKDREQRYQHIKGLLLDLKAFKEELEFAAKLKGAQAFVVPPNGL